MQFNRQFSIDQYIVDFICRKIRLIIEIAGSSHQNKTNEDEIRDIRLANLGYKILRVSEGEVLNDLNNVIGSIESHLPQDVLDQSS